MPQADGKGGVLRRVAFQIGENKWYRFAINPGSYSFTGGQRVAVFKTKSLNVVEDFGRDIPTITFSGTTGLRKDSNGKTGADRLKELKKYIEDYADSAGNGNRPNTDLTFHNFTDDESYIVHLSPEAFKIERSAEKPLLYDYTITLVVLRDASQPDQGDIVDPDLGNKQPSIGDKTKDNDDVYGDVGGADKTPEANITGRIPLEVGGNGGGAVNPRTTGKAYSYGVDELKKQIGYGEG
ncbi:hypothetical protein LP083-2_114 [Listeria phage LP-083-2]|uniref:Baseplate hub protein n=3 Tax=Pecentumvirus TaxID=1857844 RepID=A0A059T8B3_9CAUD|nr:virion structural protein [Listeria phage LP-083-2]YP_009784547.1 hypothetical protein QLX40_gp035 [Listeria phage LP-124]AHL19321.1 hypothetical protein LP083-2_114 [Listeria phage LP-083-2]AHL19432.1 hypothetical protein LP124_035 [Listeria phage LP-124]QDK04946.2 hypothetical protein FK486_0099 [Listeria phage LP-066]